MFIKNYNSIKSALFKHLFLAVDNSALILFRIFFGFLLFYHCVSSIENGVVYKNFIQPPFTFTFIGFEFLQPLPGHGMYFYFIVMALLGILIMAGAWYRFSMIMFTLLWLIVYLMQKSGYNNHYYLMLLLCFLMIFMPANAYCSWDVKRKKVKEQYDCPQWISWIFIIQIFAVYFYSATGKLSAPDWMSGKFLDNQFSLLRKSHTVGLIYKQSWLPVFIAYGGFLFDLLIVPLLLWKKTRTYAFGLACIFHLFNSFTFRIGIFPYLSIALLVFFADPEKLKSIFFKKKPAALNTDYYFNQNKICRSMISYGLIIYTLFQIALPLRPLFFQGNVFWTEEGYRMSWKMMLRTKNGRLHFKVIDTASNKIWYIDPSKKFTPPQMMWLSTSPDIIWQYAQRIKREFTTQGFNNVAVYAIDSVRLNSSNYKVFINPATDLTKVKWQPFKHSEWIMPF